MVRCKITFTEDKRTTSLKGDVIKFKNSSYDVDEIILTSDNIEEVDINDLFKSDGRLFIAAGDSSVFVHSRDILCLEIVKSPN